MSSPRSALEQMGLLKDRLSTREYQAYMQPFLEDVHLKGSGPIITDAQGRPSGWAFCNREVERLKMAEAYYVAEEMMPLVRWAAAGLSGIDRFEHDVWPTDYGFLLFEDALVSKEMWGRVTTTKAITWGRSVAANQPGTLVVFYTDMSDPRDEVNTQIREGAQDAKDWFKYERMGALHVHHVSWIPDGLRVGPEQIVPPARYAEYAVGNQHLADSTPNDTRFLLALLMLLNQTVTTVARHEMDKQATKRFRRMEIPSAITVVQLRRHAGSRQQGESLVEWAHRWVVRGHWRNQPYKGENSETVYRRIWIAPFVKGPDNAPFKQSEKVYAFVR